MLQQHMGLAKSYILHTTTRFESNMVPLTRDAEDFWVKASHLSLYCWETIVNTVWPQLFHFTKAERALAALLGTCLTPDFIALLNFCLTPGKDKAPLSRGQLHWAFPVNDHNAVAWGMTGTNQHKDMWSPHKLELHGMVTVAHQYLKLEMKSFLDATGAGENTLVYTELLHYWLYEL